MPNQRKYGSGCRTVINRLSDIGIVMLNFEGKRIYLACGATDMRKSINGLMMLVQNSFQLDPFDNGIYVFCNRSKDRLKILEWDMDGFWLYFKRLEKGHFRWPQPGESACAVTGLLAVLARIGMGCVFHYHHRRGNQL